MTLVTRDATSLKYVPVSPAELTAFAAGLGVGAFHNLHNLQDGSTPFADQIGTAPLAGSSSSATQAVSGWTRTAVNQLDIGSSQILNTSDTNLPDLNTTSMTYVGWIFIQNASPTTSPAGLFLMGPGSTEANNVVVEYTGGKFVLTDGTNTATGAVSHGVGARLICLRYNKTAGTVDLFINDTSIEKISKTFVTPASSSRGIWIGAAYHNSPGAGGMWLATLSGANAEISDAQVAALFARFTTGAVVSIAVTPSAPSVLVGGTQQLTALATFQDGSTLDVTSNANTVWTSGTPSVATINATGLLTGASIGTSSITAAFGAITSGADLVSIIGITTPTKYTSMLMSLLPPGKVWRLIGSTVLFNVLAANADELGRLETRTSDLLREAIPSTAVELLPQYESELAIVPGASDTNAQRQARIVARLVARQRYRPVDIQTALALLLAQLAANVVVIERSAAYAVSVGDAREIYRFFVYRDPTQPGAYFLAAAQTLLNAIKPSHTIGTVIESISFLCDSATSLCDRDLLGA